MKKFIISKNLICNNFSKFGRHLGKITSKHRERYKYFKGINLIEFNYANYSKNSSMAIVLNNKIDYFKNKIISLIMYIDGVFKGSKRLISSTKGVIIGDIINYNLNFPCKLGSARQLKIFPLGTLLHNVEGTPNKGAEIARASGTFIKIVLHFNNKICVKMPSGQLKLIHSTCFGIFGISDSKTKIKSYLAGHSRKLGKRPTVRGVAMNPIDHPHGGGEGKTGIGLKSSKTPWGKFSYGVSTRKSKKVKNKFLIK